MSASTPSRLAQMRALAAAGPVNGSEEAKRLNEDLRRGSIAESTARQYGSAVRLYEAVSQFPTCAEEIQKYVRFLLATEPPYKADPICSYISAVITEHELRGFDVLSPTDQAQLSRVRASVKRKRVGEGQERKKAAIIGDEPIDALIKLHTTVGSLTDQTKTLALLTTALVARVDETYDLRGEAVKVDRPGGVLRLRIDIRGTKTNVGVTTKETECPSVSNCTARWCIVHELVKRKEALHSQSLRFFPDLRKTTFAARLRELLCREYPTQAGGWNLGNITGHSMRRTAASRLVERGIGEEEVRRSGEWRSNVYGEYCEEVLKKKVRKHAHLIIGDTVTPEHGAGPNSM